MIPSSKERWGGDRKRYAGAVRVMYDGGWLP